MADKRTRITFRIPEEQYNWLISKKKQNKEDNKKFLSVNKMIEEAIDTYMKAQ